MTPAALSASTRIALSDMPMSSWAIIPSAAPSPQRRQTENLVDQSHHAHGASPATIAHHCQLNELQ
jgi:hypothetical protein